MILFRMFAALLLVGSLAACGGDAAQTTRSTYTDAQGRKQESTNEIKCTRTAGMPLPPGCSGYDYSGYGGYYGTGYYQPAEVLPRGTVLVQGPGPACPVVARRLSGQDNCVNSSAPPSNTAYDYNRGGSGYYYNPATNSQGQYGFPSR